MGFWSVLSFVIGSTIGAGIFIVPSSLAVYGSLGLAGWGISALGVFAIASSFMRLSSRYTESGGPYIYCYHALGNFAGFQVAWLYWISQFLCQAALAVGFTSYLSGFIPHVHTPLWGFISSAGVVWILAFLNLFGLKNSSVLQMVLTIIKIGCIVGFIIFGFPHITFDHFSPIIASGQTIPSVLMGATTVTLWSFLGFETGTIPSSAVINAKKNVPRALFWGIWGVVILSFAMSILAMGILPQEQLAQDTSPFIAISESLFGPSGKIIITLLILISIVGIMNAVTMAEGQLPFSAERHHFFPKILAATPNRAILFSTVLITALIACNYTDGLAKQFQFLLLFSTVTSLLTYTLSMLSDAILLRKDGHSLPWLSLLIGGLYMLAAFVGAGLEQIFLVSCLCVGISPIYWFLKK